MSRGLKYNVSICDALRDLVLFVQFRKRGKNPYRKTPNFTESTTPPWVFFMFVKLYKWCQILQRIRYLFEKQRQKTASKIDAPTLHHKEDCKKVKIVQCKHICKHCPLQSSGCVFIPCFQFFSGSALNCYLSNKGHATIFENVDQITHFVLALRYRWSVAT